MYEATACGIIRYSWRRLFGYHVEKHILQAETLRHGTVTLSGVPLTVWHFLMAAPSKGLFFYQHVKNRYHQIWPQG
ncbi:conserved hypothetical protein [Erwinia sp. Ejp617]|nr:KTSC domain-containing protein [Erwinia sp. Ejp617]ADP11714.1 conserved hypothetical protein [Erwinia sp. Ejp617]